VKPLTAILVLLLAGCGGNSGGPSPQPLSVTCPATVNAQADKSGTVVVHYPAPIPSGGQAPFGLSCTPGSGTSFVVGETPVACTATDAAAQTAACSFKVVVAPVPPTPQLSVTRFVAFGDSLTEGKLSTFAAPGFVFPETTYTIKLQNMLNARYTDQQTTVVNEGCGGEKVTGASSPCAPKTDTLGRFNQVLIADAPQVVLLLEGVNDLADGGQDAINDVIDVMRRMIDSATARGVRVFLATLPPEKPQRTGANGAQWVPEMNGELAALAASRAVPLVDLYAAFNGDLTLVGDDGVHLTNAGYELVAQTFFDAITQRLELPPASGLTWLATPPRWPPAGSARPASRARPVRSIRGRN